jgi:acyl-CoA reductase-like NAD-dependent aldehyde dehydrogenase
MSADCDTGRWFFADVENKLPAMGKNLVVGSVPHYREVLVANAVQSVRDAFPTIQAFTAERRGWLVLSAAQDGWRAVAIAAAAIGGPAATR